MNLKKLFVLATFAAMSSPVWAANRTITLSVPSMTCPVCPITIKKALTKILGVEKVNVRLNKKEVNVTFDDEKTNIQTITRATKDAGYPSSVVRRAK